MAKVCKKCLVTDDMKGVYFDVDGICEACRAFALHPHLAEKNEAQRLVREKDLENTIASIKSNPDSEYDCILSFSGGKDSCYLLYKLVKEYNLRVLAYISDFDIPKNTWDNINRTLAYLNVDSHVERPSNELYKRFIRYLLQNQRPEGAVHTVCYFWLDIREGDILRLAMSKKIPVIFTGYSPGQPDPSRMLYEMPQQRIQQNWTPEDLFSNGLFDDSERSLFWNPNLYPKNSKFPRILAPYHAWEYNQEDVMNKVVELGLAKNKLHVNPVLSNFTLNWLLIYSDLDKLGYNPYKPEFSQLVREGKAKRWVWLHLFNAMDYMVKKKILLGKHVDTSLKWLDLEYKDLKMAPQQSNSDKSPKSNNKPLARAVKSA